MIFLSVWDFVLYDSSWQVFEIVYLICSFSSSSSLLNGSANYKSEETVALSGFWYSVLYVYVCIFLSGQSAETEVNS